uniref:Zinc knuckle CX2CX4HX4C n=1 Tax=Tanacetum cinerariifolium TaxID=118510 RepID=A0A699V6K5_TANCI|nr:zinc knuckle CX2CX4HX4C [Tanacetum cinerariifolium]
MVQVNMETIKVEYKWQPPRCDTFKIFDHNDDHCPKKVKVVNPTMTNDDGFMNINQKYRKGKQPSKPKHTDGVRLTKPKPNYYYHSISKPASGNGKASTS